MDVRLAPLTIEYRDAVQALVDDPDVTRFTRFPDPPAPGFAERWIARYESGRRTGEREAFALIAGEGFLGVGLAASIDREAREVELGYIVAAHARGRGVATAALRQLTDWAFADLGALRIALVINADNRGSLRVAERCGYVREGLMRSTHLKDGVRVDAELWSRLPGDPPPPDRG